MKFSLIGMSGTGKTYWSKKLEKLGFKRFGCDDLLEKKLKGEFNGIRSVAKWMGQPYEADYHKNSQEYLACEERAMKEILKQAQNCREDFIIDTTGSVIYLSKSILKKLACLSKVIYIKPDSAYQKEMYKLYLKDPKPVFWGKSFKKKAGESNQKALARCYLKLLEFRASQYEKIAKVTLDFNMLNNSRFRLKKFMEAVI